MKKRSLFVYYRPDASDTLHWMRSCPRCRGGPSGSRVITLDWEWQEAEALTDAPPSIVVERALQLFSVRVCVDCFPEAVLDRLGLAKLSRTSKETRVTNVGAASLVVGSSMASPPLTPAVLRRYLGRLHRMAQHLRNTGHVEEAEAATRLHESLGVLLTRESAEPGNANPRTGAPPP